MTRIFGRWSAFAATAAVAGWLLAVPVAAQNRGGSHGGGGGASGGGSHAGGGAAAGGGSHGASSGGATSSGGSSGASGGSSGGSASGSSAGNTSGGSHGGGRDFSVGRGGEGQRGGASGQARSGAGNGGGAVARQPMSGTPSTGSNDGGTSTPTATGGHATTRDAGTRATGRDATAGDPVPPYSRPRGDKPQIGTAVPRTGARPSPGGTTGIYGYPWYYPFGFGGLGYYGLYDPLYDPWGYDPYGGGGYGGGYYGGGYYGGGQDPTSYDRDEGSVRLKVKPSEAEVYIDGYYMGVVNDFDGLFQRLHIAAGPHRVEIRAAGYEPLTFDIRVEAHQTLTFKGELHKIQ